MLGLPDERDPGDVERIFKHVSANRPGMPAIGWGKSLLYGSAAALLIGSLLYNLTQYHTNKNLYSSLDSLKRHMAIEQMAKKQSTDKVAMDNTTRHPSDTIYITRFRDRVATVPRQSSETLDRAGEGVVSTTNPSDETITIQPDRITNAAQTDESTPFIGRREISPVQKVREGARFAGKQTRQTSDSASIDSDETMPLSVKNAGVSKVAALVNGSSVVTKSARSERLSTNQGEIVAVGRSVAISKAEKRTKKTNVNQESVRGTTGSYDPASPVNQANGVTLHADFLSSLKLAQYADNSKLTRSVVPLPVVAVVASVHRFRVALPHIAVAGSSYWAGVGVGAGHDQLSSALLGEWRLNTHWSIQTGVQAAFQHEHFFSEDDFQKRTRQDFRTLYAPTIPPGYELLDISQSYQLVQLPLTVAYHYPLGHHWSLRFGVGTTINLYAQNRFTFDYSPNSRSFDHGFYRSPAPVPVINTVVVSAGMEREWKGWLFRVSPFVSPQLKLVAQEHERLLWGVQAGIMHRFGRR